MMYCTVPSELILHVLIMVAMELTVAALDTGVARWPREFNLEDPQLSNLRDIVVLAGLILNSFRIRLTRPALHER